jgi:hypothetical protein
MMNFHNKSSIAFCQPCLPKSVQVGRDVFTACNRARGRAALPEYPEIFGRAYGSCYGKTPEAGYAAFYRLKLSQIQQTA